MYCPNCGCTNNDNATVCENCGTELKSSLPDKKKSADKKMIIILAITLAVLIAIFGIIGLILHNKSNKNAQLYNDAGYTTQNNSKNDEILAVTEETSNEEDTTTKKKNEVSTSKKEVTKSTKKIDTTKATKKQVSGTGTTKKSSTSSKKPVHTEYRYRDKAFTTSSKSSMNGWTLYDTTYSWSSYGAWSNWSTSSIPSSSSRQVGSRTTYRYCAFVCTRCGNRDPYSTPCDNCRTSAYFRWDETWYPTKGNSMKKYTLSTVPDKYYVYIDGVKWWFERDGYSDGQGGIGQPSRKEYRYRDRKKVATYHFYKWNNWSAWSTNPVSSSANREVETRKVN